MSCIVSTKPLMTVSGVFNSCETLAMKSRRMRANASSCVTSRDISIFLSSENGTSCNNSVIRASRPEATTIGLL